MSRTAGPSQRPRTLTAMRKMMSSHGNDAGIAAIFGVAKSTVQKWRADFKLPPKVPSTKPKNWGGDNSLGQVFLSDEEYLRRIKKMGGYRGK